MARRPLQRQLPQRRPSEIGDSAAGASAHGDEASADDHAPLPREDRAG